MTAHHLKLHLDKTELLLVAAKDCSHRALLVTVEDIALSPSLTARNPLYGTRQSVMLHREHSVARSCRFALYKEAQVLVQALTISRLDYCNSLLARLPDQTVAVYRERCITPHVQPTIIPPFPWLHVVARIRFKTMVLAYRAFTSLPPIVSQTTHTSSSAPLNDLSWTHGPAIAKGKQRLHIKVTPLLYSGTTVVEQAPCRCQGLRVNHQLPQKTQESLVQSSPGHCCPPTLGGRALNVNVNV